MIALIEGTLLEAAPLEAVIQAGGLGYAVAIPVTTAEKLPRTGETVRLHTHAVYREDSQALYGFWTREERDFFRVLTEKVSGIGPKTALSIMSGLSLASLQSAIRAGDAATLAKCHGIGKKTAERLCLELKDKVGGAALTASTGGNATAPSAGLAGNRIGDAVAALVTLGFKPEPADRAVRRAAEKLPESATTEEIIREALR